MKIFTIVGARPNFLKIDKELPQTIIHTGQHYDYEMSKVFFSGLQLPEPMFNLDCQNFVGQMIDKLMVLFEEEKPDAVIVYGDTHSALAGALAASYKNIKVIHIEAGLRSKRMDMPEEVNRKIIDHISTVLFCPDTYSQYNLYQEGIKDNVHVVGDPLFDTFLDLLPIPKSDNIYEQYSVVTIHRNFNTDKKDRLEALLKALEESKEKFIFPLHPRTAKKIEEYQLKMPSNVEVVSPLGYKEMINTISNARVVVTDSGGVQREAFWMNKPIIIYRDETEWEEIIKKGSGVLANEDTLLTYIKTFKNKINPAPDRGAKERIRKILYKYI